MNSNKHGHPSAILHLIAHVVRAAYYTLTLVVLLAIGHGVPFAGGDRTVGRPAKLLIGPLAILHFSFGSKLL